MPPDLRRAALAYAAHGWAVFPLRPGEKTPACAHGCKDATTDQERIDAWWSRCPDHGIGIATGAVSGICVVDLDGDPRTLVATLLRRGPLPATMATRTGSGGMHLIYRLDGARVPSSARKLAALVDTRGEGGYIVAPPSRHPSGRLYELANELPVAAVPAWIVRALTEVPAVPARVPQRGGDGASSTLLGPVNRLRRAVNGERNAVLFWAACRLCEQAESAERQEALERLRAAAADVGLSELEVKKTLRSAQETVQGR